jgi:diguanylate cyclase (GGDEF)-like protein/PAS domain S-box-containing protein
MAPENPPLNAASRSWPSVHPGRTNPKTAQIPARLLVVDDEPMMMRSLSQLLMMRGFDVRAVDSAERAIELLDREDFDLILLDLSMPGKDGFAVMQHNRHGRAVATIVVSAVSEADAAIRAMREGATDFLRKPYEPEQLLRIVEETVTKQRLAREHAELTEKLALSERWHRYLVNTSPDVIYALDTSGRFTFLNDRVESILGFEREELIGRHYTHLVWEDDLDRARYVFNERRTGHRATRDIELRLKANRRSQSSERHVTVELSAIGMYEEEAREGNTRFQGTYGVAKDVSERKRATEAIYHQAYHDLLTGLPNRLLFQDRLNLAIAQAKRTGGMVAVMFLDLDRFKIVNDTLGHIVGDQLLQAVAARLANCVREGDTLARTGGDEFLLMLPHIANRDAAANAARKILAVLDKPFRVGNQEHFSGASIGIAVFPEDGDSIEVLIKNADVAMYEVKANGRNDYAFFSQARQINYPSRLSLENDLRRAINGEQFELYYQPKVSARTAQIVGLEALLRWNHPVRGHLLPTDFIALAEESGVIAYLSEWVLKTVISQLSAWRRAGIEPIRIAINLPVQQVEQPSFSAKFAEMLRVGGADPSLLDIEITESTMMQDMNATQEKLRALCNVGVKVAIDDFGTGYSSLSYLRHLPIDSIKIDQSFVSDIRVSEDNAIVSAMMLIAKGLKLKVVAEGVETWEQYEFLRSHGCDEMQGFLFSKPLNAQATAALLIAKKPLLPYLS